MRACHIFLAVQSIKVWTVVTHSCECSQHGTLDSNLVGHCRWVHVNRVNQEVRANFVFEAVRYHMFSLQVVALSIFRASSRSASLACSFNAVCGARSLDR